MRALDTAGGLVQSRRIVVVFDDQEFRWTRLDQGQRPSEAGGGKMRALLG
jgi:hypothetical protein